MNDNQFKLITFICFISISFSLVFCKNNQLSFDDSRLNELNWNSKFILPQSSYKNRFDLLNQQHPFNKETELNDRLNGERKQLLNSEILLNLENENNQPDYRPKLRGIEGLIELNNDPQSQLNRFIEKSNDDKLHLNEKLKNLNILLNNNNKKINDEFVNRQIRSDQTNKQRAYIEPNLINLLNEDLLRAFRRDFFKKDNIGESDEIVELVNGRSSLEKKNLNEQNYLNDNLKQLNKKDNDKTTKQSNTNNYESETNQQKSITKQSNNRPVFRKNKLNRVSKSAKFLGNNVSDCIKSCVSQGILHPVQCHSLC